MSGVNSMVCMARCFRVLSIILAICLFSGLLVAEQKNIQSWFFEAENGDINVGLNGVVEKEVDASGKKAVVSKVGRNAAKLYHRPLYKGPCSMEYPFGEYEAVFRMKVNKITGNKPVVQIELRREGSKYNEPALKKWVFKSSDFLRPNSYQDFKIRFQHIPKGWLQLHVIWLGGADFSFDSYRLKLIRKFSSEELEKRWPHSELRSGLLADKTFEVVFLKGPFYQYQRIEQALKEVKESEIYDAYMQKSYVFYDYSLDGYFPDINEHWYGLDVLILGGVDAEALGLKRRRRISEFVNNCGGGLIMLPGPYSFGKGRFQGTAIEKVLPVTIESKWDWKKFDEPQKIEITSEVPELTKGLELKSSLYTLWYTFAKPRKGAKVVLQADGVPILVVNEVGKGRSAAILALPCGQWNGKKTPFWDSEDWTKIMKKLIIWLSKGDKK